MVISHVVAVSENRVIGKDGQMPWLIPGEQKIFKRLTVGKALILGRKTHESIGRVLPDRTTIIVSRQKDYDVAGAYVVHSIEEAIKLAGELGLEDIVIGGGGELFAQTLPFTDKVYLKGGTTYPVLSGDQFVEKTKREFDASIPYSFIEFERKA